MTPERFVEVLVEEGMPEPLARQYLAGKPDEVDLATDVTEESARTGARMILLQMALAGVAQQ